MGKYKDNPWLGLESYQENQTIYGRNKEIEELSQCVLNNNETVLYGKSGIGKSSIINAGIIPVMRKHGYIPVVVRLDHSNRHSYIKQLSDLIEKGTNVSKCTIVKPVEEQLLWEYFHTHCFSKTKEKKSKLVVIFDQFEEIFTLQNNATIKVQFFKELGDVLNNVMPKGLIEEPSIETTDSQSNATEQKSVSGFADMADLFSSLAASVNNSASKYIDDNDIHFVFTLREDFLSEFEFYTSKIPSLKQHRYALRPLNEEQAAEVILKPRPELVDEGVARIIIETVTNRTDFTLCDEPEIDVDAAVLSLFLCQIYDKRDLEDSPISIDLIRKFGKDIIKDFYEESIEDLSHSQIAFLEEELLTGENRRDSLSRSDFKAGGFSEAELKRLIDDKKLLRQFHYEGDLRVEFIHDILCPIVSDHKKELDAAARLKRKRNLVAAWSLLFLVGLGVSFGALSLIKEKNANILLRMQNEDSYSIRRILLGRQQLLSMREAEDLFRSASYNESMILTKNLNIDEENVNKLYKSILFSPDGKYILSARNNEVRRVNVESGECVRQYTSSSGSIEYFTFSPNGKLILSSSTGGSIYLWDSETGERLEGLERFERLYLKQDSRYVMTASGFTQDSRYVVMASKYESKFIIHDIEEKCDRFFDGHQLGISSVTFSPDGRYIISESYDKTVRLWNVNTTECIHTFNIQNDATKTPIFSPDGRFLVISDGNTISIYDIISYDCINTFNGNDAFIELIAYSPDRSLLLAAFDDHTIRLWDVVTGACVHIFEGHTDSVNSVMFSSDSRYILSASDDKSIRLWDVVTGACVHTFEGHTDSVNSVMFSSDGRYILSASDDKSIRLWDVVTGVCVHTFEGHTDSVNSVMFSPDGRFILSTSDDNTMRLWNVEAWTRSRADIISKTPHWVTNECIPMAFSSDGNYVAILKNDNTFCLLDIETGLCTNTFSGHSKRVNSVAFSSDSRNIVSASSDKTVRLWDVTTGKCSGTLKGHSDKVNTAVFSSDGQFIVSAADDKYVNLWDVETKKLYRVIAPNEHDSSVTISSNGRYVFFEGDWPSRYDIVKNKSIIVVPKTEHVEANSKLKYYSFSSDGQYMVSVPDSDDDTVVYLDDLETGVRVILPIQGDSIESAIISPDNRFVLIDCKTAISIYDIVNKELRPTIFCSNNNCLSISPDGLYVATVSSDNVIRIWDVEAGICIRSLKGHTDDVHSLMFSHDGCRLVSSSYDRTIRIWNVQTGDCVNNIPQNISYSSFPFSLSSDGRYVLSINDTIICLWDTMTGLCLHKLKGHSEHVNSVSYSPGDRYFVSTSDDQTVRIWNIENGNCFYTIKGHTGKIKSAASSPDGCFAAYASDDQTVRLWNFKTGRSKIVSKHIDDVNYVGFSPDGRHIISASSDSTVHMSGIIRHTFHCVGPVCFANISSDNRFLVAELEDGLAVFNVKKRSSRDNYLIHDVINDWALCPNGKYLVYACGNTISVFDIERKFLFRTLIGHTDNVNSVMLSSDGRYVVSASDDRTVRLWSVETGTCINTIGGFTNAVTSAMFSPDGRYIISLSADNSIGHWAFPPLQELIDQNRERFKNNPLTPEERRRYYKY